MEMTTLISSEEKRKHLVVTCSSMKTPEVKIEGKEL